MKTALYIFIAWQFAFDVYVYWSLLNHKDKVTEIIHHINERESNGRRAGNGSDQ